MISSKSNFCFVKHSIRYDEQGDAIIKPPKYLANNAEYPFNLKDSGNKIYPGKVTTMGIADIGKSTEWVRARLEMQQSLNSPAKFSAQINIMVTEAQDQLRG